MIPSHVIHPCIMPVEAVFVDAQNGWGYVSNGPSGIAKPRGCSTDTFPRVWCVDVSRYIQMPWCGAGNLAAWLLTSPKHTVTDACLVSVSGVWRARCMVVRRR